MTAEELEGRITAETAPDTVVLRISVSDPAAAQAARIADAVQDRLVRTADTLARGRPQGRRLTAVRGPSHRPGGGLAAPAML